MAFVFYLCCGYIPILVEFTWSIYSYLSECFTPRTFGHSQARCQQAHLKFSEYIRQISHNAPFCNRNVQTCAHFCYKMVHCEIWNWRTVEFVQKVYVISQQNIAKRDLCVHFLGCTALDSCHISTRSQISATYIWGHKVLWKSYQQITCRDRETLHQVKNNSFASILCSSELHQPELRHYI